MEGPAAPKEHVGTQLRSPISVTGNLDHVLSRPQAAALSASLFLGLGGAALAQATTTTAPTANTATTRSDDRGFDYGWLGLLGLLGLGGLMRRERFNTTRTTSNLRT